LLAGGDPTGDALLAAGRRAGSDAPTFHALAMDAGDDARVTAWLARLGARLHAPITCGEARRQERVLIVAAPRGGTIETHPGLRRVRITLAPGWSEPVLVVEDAHGHVERIVPSSGVAELPSDLEPPLRLQLVARGPDGPRPIAERLVGAPPASEAVDGVPLDARIDAIRRRAGVPPLRPHRLLAAAAREHAEAVCRAGRAAHELEPGADPRERLRAHGLVARHVGEVVARGADPDAAFAALMRSPVHRSAMVDRRFTDVGTGATSDAQGRVCVVVLLAAWPRLSLGGR
jgi:hypothetical protein